MNISRREQLILLLKKQPMTPSIKKQIQQLQQENNYEQEGI
tara:strand:+ start:291 stop:413 length:123 start_codon:yes stop_codon:yes gene_type:complete